MSQCNLGRAWTWIVLCACAAIGVGLNSCSDESTQANSLVAALPFAELTLKDTTISATAGSTLKQFTIMNSRVILVGRHGGYTANALFQFYPAYFPARDTAVVLSAKLKLYTVSSLGNGPFSFNVYRTDLSWTASTFTWDSLQAGLYDQSALRGSFTANLSSADTQEIVIDLDTAMVRAWLATPTSTTNTNYGIILVPTSSTNMVIGLNEFATDTSTRYPTLEIVAGNVAGTAQDTSLYISGQGTFVGNIDNLNTDPGLLYMQSGVAYRSTLTFDVSFIPQGSIINRAEMLLNRQPASSMLTKFTADTAISPHVILSADNLSYESELRVPFGRRKDGTSFTFSFDIRHAVQAWVRGPNYGLLLRNTSVYEFDSFDLYTFYGPLASDATVRPKLRILYSQKKKP